MSRPPPRWLERAWRFEWAPALLPNMLARLAHAPAGVAELLEGAELGALAGRPDGGWSVLRHVGHLGDLEPLWLARVEAFVTGESELPAADMTNRVTHDADHDARSPDELLGRFRMRRRTLVMAFEEADEDAQQRFARHPRLQVMMRLVDHAYFVAEHDDHHLAAIRHLLSGA